LTPIEPKLQHAEGRELDIDAATDFVFAAIGHLIDHAPQQVLVLDRAKLRYDWNRRLLIELGDEFVAFSFPDNSSVQ
jgi:hypothetical protein